MNRIYLYGREILNSSKMKQQKTYCQHGGVNVYDHCISVTLMCLKIADKLPFRVNEKALVRGALLHDYFLYDWHEPGHSLHGFKHPSIACENALEDYELTKIEIDMIRKHMFPLTIKPPLYRESMILCIADKIVATRETLFHRG